MSAPELWFCPNVGTDVLAMFNHPDQWEQARPRVKAFGFYEQQIYSDHVGDNSCNANVYPMLKALDVFKRLAEWQIPISIEGGCFAHWNCPGDESRRLMLHSIDRIREAGGEVAHVVLDEPATHRTDPPCQHSWETTADLTAQMIKLIRAHGVQSVGLVEAYPAVSMQDQAAFIERLCVLEAWPSFWHLDVDRYALKDGHRSHATIESELRWMRELCQGWQIPQGVVLFGQRVTDPCAYRRSVVEWANQLRGYLGGWPSRCVIQSWEEVDGKRELPPNLPESDPCRHAAIVNEVARIVAQETT